MRNRFAHDGEIIGYVEPGPGPAEYGQPGRWEWQELPASEKQGEHEYQSLLVGRDVQSTIYPVVSFLSQESRALMDRRRGGTGPGVMVWTARSETTGEVAVFGQPSYLTHGQLSSVVLRLSLAHRGWTLSSVHPCGAWHDLAEGRGAGSLGITLGEQKLSIRSSVWTLISAVSVGRTLKT